MKRLLLILSLCCSSALMAEQTAYVTDNLSTAVRSGATNEYRIVFYLPAGSSVTVLDDAAENGFIKVRDERGREGWTLERFIVETKGARVRLAETQQQLASALSTIETMKTEHEQALKSIQDKLDIANDIVRRSATFQNQISELQTKNATLEQQLELKDGRFREEVFLAGAGVIVVGMFMGMIMGRLFRKKRSSWN
ncbi:MAG: TIGR04211 family SH3 domain-containing protein [Gammaproteobacteria bacterium]|nr:TIGR04211 family SH3 domain-containing protein [Gammaproteobacteria bacterium]NVK87204.1 TIGR04211 family SH3 domain-containing protein [Gammaproteobacteria bacterium]